MVERALERPEGVPKLKVREKAPEVSFMIVSEVGVGVRAVRS